MKALQKRLVVLGIESSCDETAAGIVERGSDGGGRLLAHSLRGQASLHAPYGGVVPEIAARAHLSHLDGIIVRTLGKAGVRLEDLDAIAAGAGPGLIGGVMAGLVTGKALALTKDLPFCAVNHLEAHALSPRLVGDCAFPYLLLLISGGHSLFAAIEGVDVHKRLGETRDDALGEVFDKTARLLDLGWPGGKALEKLALNGDSARFALPRPFRGADHCDFSFAGLKSAVRRRVEEREMSGKDRADMAASFQATAAACLQERTEKAIGFYEEHLGARAKEGRRLVAAGGVASNQALRACLKDLAERRGYRFLAPPAWLCTDNGAMIAWAGAERLSQGLTSPLTTPARARWPLGERVKIKIPRRSEKRGETADR